MARRLIILGVIFGLIAAPLCAAQSLRVPKVCPVKTRCCRALPAPPSDALKPQAPQVALVHAQAPVVAAVVFVALDLHVLPAPAREVPTRIIVLRI